MMKKIAAFGVSAALVLSPLAALAQADSTAPAAPAAGDTMAKPMKAKPMHHHAKSTHHHKAKKMEPAAPAAPAEAPKS